MVTRRSSSSYMQWHEVGLFLLLLLVLKTTSCEGSNFVSNDGRRHEYPENDWATTTSSSSSWWGRNNGRGRIDTVFSPIHHDDHDDDGQEKEDGNRRRMSIVNMTCDYFLQPLNHFTPRGRSPKYQQRYCTYTKYASSSTRDNNNQTRHPPILFYTGNESPLEHYINHTGLMWELAPKLKAKVVFVEHRYEGRSLPPTNISVDCLSYASTIQALADYAKILEEKINPGNVAPVIAFGGSYGGMLSAWFRMKYPHLVAGSIAASAPIGAFPQSANDKIDFSARVLMAGLNQPYPPNNSNENSENRRREVTVSSNNHVPTKKFCSSNLLASWPLITWLVKKKQGNFLKDAFRLCEPVTDERELLKWAGKVWFDLAESSFPYPSNYIPFALLHKDVKLPAWPMQAACWKYSHLHEDWGVRFNGNISQVQYQVEYGDSGIILDVDWDHVDSSSAEIDLDEQLSNSDDILGLLSSVRDAVSIWYNITKDVDCYNISRAAPNFGSKNNRGVDTSAEISQPTQQKLRDLHLQTNTPIDPAQKICHDEIKRVGSWEPLCCNDEMNLVINNAHGLGHDFFWPPTHPRGVKTYKDAIRNKTAKPCPDPDGVFGYSKEPYEQMSTLLDTYYGGINMNGHSNIIFSNGLLDPWSAGGVYKTEPSYIVNDKDPGSVIVQNITENDVVAVIIPYGGHHTDLMYSNKADPVSITQARDIETKYIKKWISNWLITEN